MTANFEKLLDVLSAHELRFREQKYNLEMDKHGTKTEPTSFSYPKLLEFYDEILEVIESYQLYAKRYPDQIKTLVEKRRLINIHVSKLLDFHAAWYVLRHINPDITADEFKEINPNERHEKFVEGLEQKVHNFSGLYEQRKKVIDLCVKEKILPQDYR